LTDIIVERDACAYAFNDLSAVIPRRIQTLISNARALTVNISSGVAYLQCSSALEGVRTRYVFILGHVSACSSLQCTGALEGILSLFLQFLFIGSIEMQIWWLIA
jgi:hypothetical protein